MTGPAVRRRPTPAEARAASAAFLAALVEAERLAPELAPLLNELLRSAAVAFAYVDAEAEARPLH